ncbi:hypothetical protein Bca101_067662 [Brassica carinata]
MAETGPLADAKDLDPSLILSGPSELYIACITYTGVQESHPGDGTRVEKTARVGTPLVRVCGGVWTSRVRPPACVRSTRAVFSTRVPSPGCDLRRAPSVPPVRVLPVECCHPGRAVGLHSSVQPVRALPTAYIHPGTSRSSRSDQSTPCGLFHPHATTQVRPVRSNVPTRAGASARVPLPGYARPNHQNFISFSPDH